MLFRSNLSKNVIILVSADYGDKDPGLDGIDNSLQTLCLSVTEHALEGKLNIYVYGTNISRTSFF